MKSNRTHSLGIMMVGLAVVWAGPVAQAARPNAQTPQAPLTDAGQRLEQQYADMLAQLKAELRSSLPTVDERKKAAYLEACQAEEAAKAAVKEAEKAMDKIDKAKGLVAHAKGKWIREADREIAAAQARLKAATTDEQRAAAEEELAKWQANRAEGEAALARWQGDLDEAMKQEPQLRQAVESAKQALVEANARTMEAFAALQVEPLLAGDDHDASLAKFVVLLEATPRGLAAFAQQSARHEALVARLLADEPLMLQMVLNDGAAGGDYGRAMEIYTAIQQSSSGASEGTLQRLALAVALEHAVPLKQSNPKAWTDRPATIDPVKRYQHFEAAFLNDELDPAFKHLSVWDMRMVVNGDEPDETLAWGRQMLRNYRPDHITTADYAWRYVGVVRTEIRYGSQDVQFDRPDLQGYQNMLMNGGICGRRAFFGRFILRAFGIPTTARPQTGHAALVHWTPEGWVVCLGAGWGSGWTKTRYDRDLDFLATTQAREDMTTYLQVKRAQWIGDVAGERRVFGLLGKARPGFWYGVSLHHQRALIDARKVKTLAAVGEELGEANESDVKYAVETAAITESDRTISISDAGAITIPAAACSKPTTSTDKILFMPSVLGGLQMHYSRNGKPETFEYTFDAPRAGVYELAARVVTPSWQQHLLVTSNDAPQSVQIDLPNTVGMWETTAPVRIELVEGRNVLHFEHRASGYPKGVTIKDFTLTPVK